MPLWKTDERFGPVPAWLGDLLRVVLADFQQPEAIDLLIGYDEDSGIVWFSEPGQAGRAGFGVPFARTRPADARYTVETAHWLQEQLFPETEGAWGEPRPQCPGHPHPMIPAEVGGEAWWTCPVDDRSVVRIGAFGG